MPGTEKETLRDKFAVSMAQTLLTCNHSHSECKLMSEDEIAAEAYKMADAMLSARG